jgi:MFS family permease
MGVIAMAATAFGFVMRALSLGDWARDFHLDATQQGALAGVGLWPFAISIALISLLVDKVGFRVVLWSAFACHLASSVMLVTAHGYNQLFWGTFVLSVGNGAIEAAVNPLTATVFRQQRVRWLNYLHAGWPAGLLLGALLSLVLHRVGIPNWRIRVAMTLLPTLIYGALLLKRRFPVTERVAASVSFREMLCDAGAGGAFLVTILGSLALGSAFYPEVGGLVHIGIAFIAALAFFAYTRSLGHWLFLLILLIMIPQAITELGTSSWVSELVEPATAKAGFATAWVMVVSNIVLLAMRLNAGRVVRRFSPLSMLAFSSAISAAGMAMFAVSNGPMVILAALLFGIGTAFFWPTTLGFVADQFPRAGSVGINFAAAVGMMAAGTIGSTLMGTVQDRAEEAYVLRNGGEAANILGDARRSFGMQYRPIDRSRVDHGSAHGKAVAAAAEGQGKKRALRYFAVMPACLFLIYLILLAIFRSTGGYKPKLLRMRRDDDA